VQTGVRQLGYDKSAVFNPKKITAMNYGPGAHFCQPQGVVNFSNRAEIKLLHYKYFGLKHLRDTAKVYAKRLRGIQYDWGQLRYRELQHATLQDYKQESQLDKV
jgi:hypothetical protein